ncbi:MAG: helix-turn-helix domain-containing protein [archaeon]
MEEELKLLGLNDIDVKVYLTLLKNGESLASEVANKAEIPRASVYDILERLEQEGLVSYIVKDFKKYFSAAEPKTIVKNLDNTRKRIEDILPELEKIKNSFPEEKIKTEVYEGAKGLQTILNMMLEEKEMFIMGASRKSMAVLPYFMEKWHKERIKKKIAVTIIYNDTLDVRESMKKEETKKLLGVPIYWKHKFLSVDYSSPLMTLVFGNKVAMINFKQDSPSAILIESKDVAETYKQYILNLWNVANK